MNGAAELTLVVLALAVLGLAGAGVFVGSRRTGLSQPAATRRALKVTLLLIVWLGFTAALSRTGVLANWSARPPSWPLLPLTAFLIIALLTRTASAKRVLSGIPPAWLIATQSFRIAVELALYALYVAGRAPQQITFEGRNADVLVGLSAPIIAWLVARGRVGKKGIVIWNVLGLLVLFNTVATVATSTPGPLHLDWPGAPLTAVVEWPIVWLPAFLMPFAVFLHISSLRQCRTS